MIGIIISIIMLGLASFDEHSYGYYQILRIVVFITSIYVFIKLKEIQKFGWLWIFGTIALIFNPLIPLHLGKSSDAKELWQILDFIALLIFLIIIPIIQPRLKKIYKIIGICAGAIVVILLIYFSITELKLKHALDKEKYFTQSDILKDYYNLPESERKKINITEFQILQDFEAIPFFEKQKIADKLGFSLPKMGLLEQINELRQNGYSDKQIYDFLKNKAVKSGWIGTDDEFNTFLSKKGANLPLQKAKITETEKLKLKFKEQILK